MKSFKPQVVLVQKGSFFGEEHIFADDRCFGTRETFACQMDQLVTQQIVFRFTCKSLEALVMSISVDEFIRMLSKEDTVPTLRKLRQQFIVKTKIQTDKILEDDFSSDEEDEPHAKKKKQKVEEQAVNPIKIFKQKQREFLRQKMQSPSPMRQQHAQTPPVILNDTLQELTSGFNQHSPNHQNSITRNNNNSYEKKRHNLSLDQESI